MTSCLWGKQEHFLQVRIFHLVPYLLNFNQNQYSTIKGESGTQIAFRPRCSWEPGQKNNHDGVRHTGTNAAKCISPHANCPSVALALFAG